MACVLPSFRPLGNRDLKMAHQADSLKELSGKAPDPADPTPGTHRDPSLE